jgi:glucose-6-phosphate 1-epimerase
MGRHLAPPALRDFTVSRHSGTKSIPIRRNLGMPPLNATRSHVTLVQLGELPALRVHNRSADALIALQGAQLLAYAPRGQQPLIWLSEQAAFQRGQPVRGGIPVCWPWFGELARNPEPVRALFDGGDAPAHGLVRMQPWLLDNVTEGAEHTALTLRYPVPAGLPHWPHAVELALHIRVGRTLRLQLDTRNTGPAALELSQALHTYLAVSDVREVEVHGLDNTTYIDTLRDWQTYPQQGPVRIGGEVDRIYQGVPSRLELRDPRWRRALHLRTNHSRSAVVWNPWIDKARRLSQFGADAWQQMLCIENANVLDDCVALAPGATHSLAVELWSEALPA